MFRGSVLCGASLAFLLIAGCGGQSGKLPKWPEPVPASGVITFNEQPLPNATVSFLPESGVQGQGASGQTDEDGKYSLQSRWVDGKTKDGVIPGKYKVIISRMVKPDGSVWTPDPNKAEGPATSGAREELPMIYSNPSETKQFVEVTTNESSLDFKLKKK